MTIEIPTTDLATRWAGKRPHLITRVSFESRSLVMATALATSGQARCTCFASVRRSAMADANLVALTRMLPNATVRELDTGDPLRTASELHAFVAEEMSRGGMQDLLIDVTCFRREELLMLLAIFRALGPGFGGGSEVIYVGVGTMADELSGQVSAYRSVIGYAGDMYPSRPTRLVILMGFEFARARGIVENYEPMSLILGKGRLSQSITPSLGEMNERFHRDLRSQFNNVDSQFEFSARDPLVVAEELESAITLDETSNVIIAPLHTKLSTIGAGLYAQRHRQVQICYAAVDWYNEEGYSTPGSEAYTVSLDALLSW